MQNVSDKETIELSKWTYNSSRILLNHPIDNKKDNVYEAGGLGVMWKPLFVSLLLSLIAQP